MESFETVTVWIDQQPFTLKHAQNAQQRRQGLMDQVDLDADGMLFSYEYPVFRPFYMRRTFLPLTIAFFDQDGRFIGSREMQPMSEQPTIAPGPFQYAIEFVQGREPKMVTKVTQLQALAARL